MRRLPFGFPLVFSKRLLTGAVLVLLCQLTLRLPAQEADTAPRLVHFSGTAEGAASSKASITFALYTEQTGGVAVWQETQPVEVDSKGEYQALLGASLPDGLPAGIFNDGTVRWLGVRVQEQAEQPRIQLTSVPYALKAANADTLGGLPATAFLRADSAEGNATAGVSTAASVGKARAAAISATNSSSGMLPVFTDSIGDLGVSLLSQSGTAVSASGSFSAGGAIQSTFGGFTFPDGTTQTTASPSSKTAAVVLNESANAGSSYTMTTRYAVSGPYACPASGVIGSLAFQIKATGTITNPLGHIIGQIFASGNGAPTGSTIYNNGGANADVFALFGSLTTSYQSIRLGGNSATCTPGAGYWFGVYLNGMPTGASIVLSAKTQSGAGATSNDGVTWTSTNIALNLQALGKDTVGSYAYNDTNIPYYGWAIDQVAMQGKSENNTGGNFYSENSYGVYGAGDGGGGSFRSPFGFGVQALSQAGNGLSVGIVNTGCAWPGQTGCNVVATVGSSAVSISRTLNANQYSVTGPMISVVDAPTNYLTWAAPLLQYIAGSTVRTKFMPMVTNSASSVAYMFDTATALSAPGSKLFSFANSGATMFYGDFAGNIYTPGISINGSKTITGVQGNAATVLGYSGASYKPGDLLVYDANGNATDSGSSATASGATVSGTPTAGNFTQWQTGSSVGDSGIPARLLGSVIRGNCYGTLKSSSTMAFSGLGSSSSANNCASGASANPAQGFWPVVPGQINNLNVHLSATTISGGSLTFTVYANGVATLLACTVTNPATSCSDTVDTLVATPDTHYDVRAATNALETAADANLYFMYR